MRATLAELLSYSTLLRTPHDWVFMATMRCDKFGGVAVNEAVGRDLKTVPCTAVTPSVRRVILLALHINSTMSQVHLPA